MRTLLAMMALLCGCGEVKQSHAVDAAPGGDAADTVPVTVTLTQMPTAVTSDTSASFAWTSNKSSAMFQCKLDGAAPAACTSPMQYASLAVGPHAFEVDVTDAAGHTASATASWTISPPCTPTLLEAENVPNPTGWAVSSGNVLHNGMALSANTAGVSFQFTFTGKGLIIYYEKGPNVGTYSVTVDNGTPVNVNGIQANTFTFQNPTTVAAGLPNVQHTATVTCVSLYCEVDYFDITCQ